VALGKRWCFKASKFFYAEVILFTGWTMLKNKKDFKIAQRADGLYSQNITDNNANLKSSQESVESALNWARLRLLLFTLMNLFWGLTHRKERSCAAILAGTELGVVRYARCETTNVLAYAWRAQSDPRRSRAGLDVATSSRQWCHPL